MTVLTAISISKDYPRTEGGGRLSVLDNVSLEIEQGDSVAVVGPSGCGKSTLLHILGGLDRPTGGSLVLGRKDLLTLSDRELAVVRNKEIGFVFQQHYLLPQCTALENVLVPTLVGSHDPGKQEERARTLLEAVGLSDRLHHRPGQLSGGECQRVAIVRSLINQPKVLLADEPTGSLDADNASRLIDLLLTLQENEGVALILVTHALELAHRMQRVMKLRGGKFI